MNCSTETTNYGAYKHIPCFSSLSLNCKPSSLVLVEYTKSTDLHFLFELWPSPHRALQLHVLLELHLHKPFSVTAQLGGLLRSCHLPVAYSIFMTSCFLSWYSSLDYNDLVLPARPAISVDLVWISSSLLGFECNTKSGRLTVRSWEHAAYASLNVGHFPVSFTAHYGCTTLITCLIIRLNATGSIQTVLYS